MFTVHYISFFCHSGSDVIMQCCKIMAIVHYYLQKKICNPVG